MNQSPQKNKYDAARVSLPTMANSMEAEAILTIIGADISAATSRMATASTIEDIYRAQGNIQALTRLKGYFSPSSLPPTQENK